MTDALTKAADAAIAADSVHLANLAARRTRSPLAPSNAPAPTALPGSRAPPLQRSYTFQPHDHEAGPPTPTRERQHSDPGHQRSRRASMPDITDVSERRDSLFRQTDSGKSVYNSLEEFST